MRLRPLALLPLALFAAVPAASAPAPVPPVLLAVSALAPRPHISVYQAVAGGACRQRFAAAAASSVARISPDGRHVAYVGTDPKSVRVVTLGEASRTVLRLGSDVSWLAWSPDSRTLAASGSSQVWLVGADGRGARLLPLHLRPRALYGAPVYSPSGTQLAVSTTWGNGKAGTLRNELDLVDLHGHLMRHLALAADAYSTGLVASFSPDGTQVAYVQGAEIWLVGANGQNRHALTHRTRGIGDQLPVWSLDGTRLAFASDRTGKIETFVVNADGTGLERITTTPTGSPDLPKPQSIPLLWTADDGQLVVRRPDGFQLVVAQPGGATTTLCKLSLPQALDARFVYSAHPLP
jgi:Tol biopolymer transport system component